MSHPNPSTAMARTIVDEMTRHGLDGAVIAPGSRSTALVLALNDAGVDLSVHIDERSAAFRALGHAAATGRPGVVVTTSGSAVANLMPAVVEADRAAMPLLLLTADRPEEMVRRRTNQTMDQRSIFTPYSRGQLFIGPGDQDPGGNQIWRSAVSRAFSLALGGPGAPGPVHLNIAFEEPTVPVPDDGRVSASEYGHDTEGRDGGEPWQVEAQVEPQREQPPGNVMELGGRMVIVAGRGDYDPVALEELASRRGIPVLATALSGGRGIESVTTYHHLFVRGVPDQLQPDSVVVVGQPGPSNRIARLLETGAPVTHVDRWGLFSDISGTMKMGVREDPVAFLERTAPQQQAGWSGEWKRLDQRLRQALNDAIDDAERPTGPGVARALDTLPWSSLVVASSLPVRDVDAHLTRPSWVHSNRGVSGIDGFASTLLGVADRRPGTVGLVGDLSFLHDSNAFLCDSKPGAVIVLIDNGGGGLFDLLPQARFAPDFERFFTTDPRRDFSVLADFHDLGYVDVDSIAAMSEAVGSQVGTEELAVVRIGVDRSDDLGIRSALDAVAAEVLGV